MKKSYPFLIIILLIIFASWYQFTSKKIISDYKNASYLIDNQVVTLKNGEAEIKITPDSASKNIIKYFGNEVRADFNGDGREDIAFLIFQNSGGSGIFYYTVVALNTSNGYVGTNAIFLGDRIAPQTTEFRDDEIIVNYATRKENEPMTAQVSIGVSKYLKVQDGKLVDVIK